MSISTCILKFLHLIVALIPFINFFKWSIHQLKAQKACFSNSELDLSTPLISPAFLSSLPRSSLSHFDK